MRRMATRAVLAGGLVLALGACVNVEATRLDRSVALAPVPRDEVRVFLTPAEVPGDYRKIALLEADGDGDFHSEHDFIESMRARAAKLGANGVVLEPGLEPGPLLRTAQQLLNIEYRRYRHATAILIETGG